MPRDCPPGQTATAIATTENKFSVQLNTNQFTTGYGKIGWVQFVLQSTVDQNALCVWKVDVKAVMSERARPRCNLLACQLELSLVPMQRDEAVNLCKYWG